MWGLVVVILCGAVCVQAFHEVQFTVEECEIQQCKQICDEMTEVMSSYTGKFQYDLGCYCFCAVPKNKNCGEDTDCAWGLYCAAHDHKVDGICKDVCKKPGSSCGMYDRCVVNEDGGAECLCKKWRCSDMKIGFGVCSFDNMTKKLSPFNNDCLYINKNCDRRRAGLPEIDRLPIQDCAEVMLMNDATNSFGTVGIAK